MSRKYSLIIKSATVEENKNFHLNNQNIQALQIDDSFIYLNELDLAVNLERGMPHYNVQYQGGTRLSLRKIEIDGVFKNIFDHLRKNQCWY